LKVANVFAGLLAGLPRDTSLVLVNAAGVAVDGLLARVRDSDVTEQVGVNLLGPMHTSRAVLRHMLRCRSGCIVNVGSVVARNGSTGQSVCVLVFSCLHTEENPCWVLLVLCGLVRSCGVHWVSLMV
jgi:NAD(P)-dependent dehydrogenase (short-subunit alcohol dehydrogenase family)